MLLDQFMDVSITIPAFTVGAVNQPRTVIKGYLSSMFTTDGANQWSELFNKASYDPANDLLAKLGYQDVIMYINDTMARWTGSSIPTFDLSFTYVAAKAGDKPIDTLKPLYYAVYPINASDSQGGIQYGYHMGYHPEISNTSKLNNNLSTGAGIGTGTVILKIGKWFYAPNLLINSVKIDNSVELTPEGYPLYSTVSLSMRPIRLPTADEFIGYFSGSPVQS